MQTEDQLTTTNILSLFQTTKSERLSFSEKVIENINEGTGDPLKVLLQLKAMEDIINTITNTSPKDNKNFALAVKFKEAILDAAQKQGKEFEYESAKFRVGEAGAKFDYSKCGDNETLEMMEEVKRLSTEVKARQDLLKMMPIEGMKKVDKYGEVCMIYPPSKTSTTTLFCTLK